MTKNKWVGALLNFFVPGLGNAYGRKVKKGILTYILFFVVVISLRFMAYNFTLFLVSLTLIIGYYLYLIVSGYQDVEKDKEYEPLAIDKSHFYVLALVFHWTFVGSITGRVLDSLTPINFASIPTPAMDPGLLVGDILAFEKTKSIKRNDVTIFWFPEDIHTMYIKRCIGLPGDSLRIRNTTVFINGTPLPEIPLKFKYLVTTDGSKLNAKILQKNNIEEQDYYQMSSDAYQFFLTAEQAKALKALPFLKDVKVWLATEGEAEPMIYPKSESFDWNTDFYGSIYIPKKGDKIELTEKNVDLYLKCIEFENEAVERIDSGVSINGQLVTNYEFTDNYFFMMGDSRHNSLDSRYWGLLPQELVIGKALYLYWGRASGRVGRKVI